MVQLEPRALLLDTHILVWAATGDPRLPQRYIDAIVDPDNALFVSAVVAFELADLQQRQRIAMVESINVLQDKIGFDVLDLPNQCWTLAPQLPHIHGDPIDRMLIAHAIMLGATLVTLDAHIQKYTVITL